MKKRIVIALIATLTLTLGSFGTVFAMNSNPVIELQTNETLKQGDQPENPDGGETTDPEEPEHVHTWGDPSYVVDQEATKEWVVDKEAVYEQNWVVDKEAVYEQNWVVDKEAVYDEVKVVDKEAWTEEITEIHTVCFVCGCDFDAKGMSNEELLAHMKAHALAGEGSGYGSREVVVDTIEHPEEFHMETVLVSPEEGHYENGDLISPEEGHYESGDLISPEEGHWVTTPELGHWEHTCADCGEIQNSETGEVIKPGTLPEEPTDSSEPTDPEVKPGDDTETPGEDTQKPTDETEKPDQDAITETTDNSDKQDQQNDDKTTTPESADKNEKSNTATTTVSNEDKAPQTGDTASLIYLATLAGSAVTGGTAFGIRRKFKK